MLCIRYVHTTNKRNPQGVSVSACVYMRKLFIKHDQQVFILNVVRVHAKANINDECWKVKGLILIV